MNLKNVRIFRHDAVEVVRDMLEDNSLDGVHIFFRILGEKPVIISAV